MRFTNSQNYLQQIMKKHLYKLHTVHALQLQDPTVCAEFCETLSIKIQEDLNLYKRRDDI